MRIFLTGASGFIGRHLQAALLQRGHEVVRAVRTPQARPASGTRDVTVDYVRDHGAADWLPRLQDVDVVINAVGIIGESGEQRFDALHHRAPVALFEACTQAGVKQVIQISALGADEEAVSRYHLSKKQADDFLVATGLPCVIVQPSVVYGVDGSSAALFNLLATLPAIGLPGGGGQKLQPVHVDDLVELVLRLIDEPALVDDLPANRRLTVVGPEPLTMKSYLAQLAQAMGLGSRIFYPVPMPVVRLTAVVAERIPGSLLNRESLAMLERGNAGDAGWMNRLLGRRPRAVSEFLRPEERLPTRTQARLAWMLPMLRVLVALVWIVTGIVSLGLYPVQESYALLARVGVTGALAPFMLYGAALLNVALGVGVLVLRKRRWLWLAQLLLMGFYTALITWKLPEFWLHPYGPLLKNLPLLGAILVLMELEGEADRT